MKKFLAVFLIAAFALALPSCKSKVKDEDVKANVQSALSANPDLSGLSVDVKDGVATITGEVKDEVTRAGIPALLKDVKGVKEVVNNASVVAPPPPPVAPVITADDPLTTAVNDAIKDHPTVKASVKDGVITLTGEIKKSDLQTLMQKLNALKPKKIESKELVKK